ncbi:polymer-forming cytoskeletal protein [Eubacterium limosum]|uniref:polymer-forming cytoskeletal protein n=1 Tax=Eubacterium limosum TaxID=1736 RepID=UPI0010644990|nr:polymer-forming cytoskeletal protein [Eubacterium limosum]
MLKRLKQIKQNEQGSAIVWAIAVIMILLVILTAGMMIAMGYNNRNFQNNNERQAYYTARSVVTAVAEEITNSDESKNEIMVQLGLMTKTTVEEVTIYKVQENEADVVKDAINITGLSLPNTMVDEGESNLKTTIQVLPDTIRGSQETDTGKKLDLHQVKISCTATYKGNTRTVSAIMQEKQVTDSRGFVYGINVNNYQRQNQEDTSENQKEKSDDSTKPRALTLNDNMDLFIQADSGYTVGQSNISEASYKRNILSKGPIKLEAGAKTIKISGMLLSDKDITVWGVVQIGGMAGSTTSEAGILTPGDITISTGQEKGIVITGDVTGKNVTISGNVTITGNILAETVNITALSDGRAIKAKIKGTISCKTITGEDLIEGHNPKDQDAQPYTVKKRADSPKIKSKVTEGLEAPPKALMNKLDPKQTNANTRYVDVDIEDLLAAKEKVLATKSDVQVKEGISIQYNKDQSNTNAEMLLTLDNYSGGAAGDIVFNIKGFNYHGNYWPYNPDSKENPKNLSLNIKINQSKGDVYINFDGDNNKRKYGGELYLRIINVQYYTDDGGNEITADPKQVKNAKLYIYSKNATDNMNTTYVVFGGNKFTENWQVLENNVAQGKTPKNIYAYVYAQYCNIGLAGQADYDLINYYGNLNVYNTLEDRGVVSYNQIDSSVKDYVKASGELVTKWIIDKYEDE